MTSAVAASATALRVAEAVAGFGLSGHDDHRPLLERPLQPSDWVTLLATCRAERTVGLLVATAATGRLKATDGQVAQAEAAHSSLMGRVVLLEQVLVAASTLLSNAGVGHRVLKGSACAWLDWPEPSLRTFFDIDLLLAGDYEAGLRALESGGCRRSSVEVHRGFDRRFGKGTTMVDPGAHEVDVHRTLAAGAYGLLIKRDELLDGADPLTIGECRLLALARPQRLVHACYHATLGDGRARHATLRDVGELVLGCTPTEREPVLQLARSWDGAAPVASAINAATGLLHLPLAHPLVQWARAYEPTADEHRRLRAYSGTGRSFAAQAIEGWRVLPTIGERLTYATQLLFPDPQHLQSRGESRGHRWARGAQLARRLARR
jgi:hypothetical protein